MNGEKYVKQIEKQLMCEAQKKQDICRQLLSEIKERQNAGETIETIMQDMGTPEEIAAEFNGDLSPEEGKRIQGGKKKKIAIIVGVAAIVVIGLVWWWFPKQKSLDDSKIFSKQTVEEQLINIIDMLDAGEYQELSSVSTEQMAQVVGGNVIDDTKKQMCPDFGERKTIGTIYDAEITQMGTKTALCQVNVSYENVSVVYTISFDQNMKLAGLYMK